MKNITKEKANYLIKKHMTRDPFEIAKGENIIVLYEPLGSINGYINNSLEERLQHFACAHELGHAILHPASNTPFLLANTFQSVSKLEQQANMFALEFVDRNEFATIEQLACYYHVPVEIIMSKYYDEYRGGWICIERI